MNPKTSKSLKRILILFSVFLFQQSYAQQSINSSGGEGASANGNVSFTLGQIDFVSATGSNGSVLQGVQQAYEIYTLGVDALPDIVLEFSIYPNPTTDFLYIKNAKNNEKFGYQLFDVSGKIILSSSNQWNESKINMSPLVKGTYLLQIQTENNLSKSFKINKN